MRAVSVAFSPDRPSRRKNEPGILPAAYIRSSTSTVRGRKSTSRRLPTVAVQRTIVSPAADDDRAARLLREFAGLEGDLAVADIHRDAANVKHAHLVVYLRPPGWRPSAFRTLVLFRTERVTAPARGGRREAPGCRRRRRGSRTRSRAAPAPPPPRSGGRPRSARGRAPRPSRPLPEVRVVDVAAVGVERVDELEEGALAAGGLGRGVQRRRARVLAGDREVAEGERRRRWSRARRQAAAQCGQPRSA